LGAESDQDPPTKEQHKELQDKVMRLKEENESLKISIAEVVFKLDFEFIIFSTKKLNRKRKVEMETDIN
jgi:hypothetical protein